MIRFLDWLVFVVIGSILLVNSFHFGVRIARGSCTSVDCDELLVWWNDGTGAPYGYLFDDTHAYQQVLSEFPLGGLVSEPSDPTTDSVDWYEDCDICNACDLGGNQPDPIKWYEGELIDSNFCSLISTVSRKYCGSNGDGVSGSWY